MNFGKIYAEATKGKPKEPAKDVNPLLAHPNPTNDAALASERINWLSSPVTSDMLKEMGNSIDKLEEEAHTLAWNYAQHQNPLRIVHLLNQATVLRNIIHQYGRNS